MDMKEKIYRFKVSLKLQGPKIYREMELKGASSLREFAKAITGAFDFALDHAFGFYCDIFRADEYAEKYTGGNNKTTYIYNVFEPGRVMLFLFDYGDEWEFLVECSGTSEAETDKIYPTVTKKVGQAPPQYPHHSDDEYDYYFDDVDDESNLFDL